MIDSPESTGRGFPSDGGVGKSEPPPSPSDNPPVENGRSDAGLSDSNSPSNPTANAQRRTASVKPDYGTFCRDKQSLINDLLGHPVTWNDINRGFTPDFAFYFVAGEYFAITQNMDLLFKTFKAVLPAPKFPSKNCITNLRNGGPLSLFEILRLHLALEHLRTTGDLLYRQQVGNTLVPLIGRGSVIPSLRLIDSGALDSLQKSYAVSDKTLVHSIEAVLKKPVRNGFLAALKEGQRVGAGSDRTTDRLRPYRVTDFLAAALCAAFEKTTDLAVLKTAVDRYFPCDPTAGPGNGRYTVALPEKQGNHVALIP